MKLAIVMLFLANVVQAVWLLILRFRNRELSMDLTDCIERNRQYANEQHQLRRLANQARTHVDQLQSLLPLLPLILLCCFGFMPVASAQSQQVGSIVSNGQLQNREFSLLLIHSGDQLGGQVVGMLTQPRSPQLRQWTEGLHLRTMHVSEPFVEHHRDLFQKHQNQLPILALVDQGGGAWWSAAGDQLATSEKTLVEQMANAYAGTLRAAAESAQRPGPPMQDSQHPNRNLAQSFGPGFNGGFNGPSYGPAHSPSRFLEQGAPDPITIPSVNVTTNPPAPLPASQPSDDSTLLLIGVLCVVCSLILAASIPIGSTIIANAMTDEQD